MSEDMERSENVETGEACHQPAVGGGKGDECQIASLSDSPVRMRKARSTGLTKILPSPICPVWAAERMASMTESAISSRTTSFDAQLREEAHDIFSAAIDLAVALLAAIALGFADGHAVDLQGHQSFANVVESKGLNNGRDEFHDFAILGLRRNEIKICAIFRQNA